ncbi:MAG: hypothetical protein M0C28_35380 [Candidatus Moduliflexus flocculans]|nr:hypothetical protein [Candidatus Moduliflexus flocculans]
MGQARDRDGHRGLHDIGAEGGPSHPAGQRSGVVEAALEEPEQPDGRADRRRSPRRRRRRPPARSSRLRADPGSS